MLSDMARIALVGGGSMGEALLSGLLRAGRQVKDLVVAERMPDRARYLADTYGVLVTTLPDAVENATFVIIAVKPSDVGSVIGEIGKVAADAAHDSPDQVFITVAAGVATAYLRGLPADGWLRVVCTCVQIGQDWFDEDHTVVDSQGRIIVQSRQLAMVPAP
ncbi:MAG: pyrroline-5-carboxylate reductase [Mycobacterium sp.]|nr:pyrroline-5-carboxylate reductase [Mycobacterium sp.]